MKKNKVKRSKTSKILTGTATTFFLVVAVFLPVILTGKKITKESNQISISQYSKKDIFLEYLQNLTEEELELIDKKHLKKGNRENWYSGDPEMDKWIKEAIHKIKGLEKLPDNDIVITPDKIKGDIKIEIQNHEKIKHLILNGFVNETDYKLQKSEVEKKINDIKHLVAKPGKEKWFYEVKSDSFDSNDFDNHVKTTLNIKEDNIFSYNLTYPEIKINGDLEVTIEIKNGAAVKTQNVTFKIFWINKKNENNLTNAKTAAEGEINKVDLPKEDSVGDTILFEAIGDAIQNALDSINLADSIDRVNQAKTVGLSSLNQAIAAYNNDLSQAKLTNAQTLATQEVNDVNLPTQDTDDGNGSLFAAVDTVKNSILQAIADAQSTDAVNTAKTNGLTNLRNAIKAYQDNLNQAKLTKTQNAAKAEVNAESLPTEEVTNGDADLFAAIANTKDTTLQAIDDAQTEANVTKAKTDGLTNLRNAIKAYQENLIQAKYVQNELDRLFKSASLSYQANLASIGKDSLTQDNIINFNPKDDFTYKITNNIIDSNGQNSITIFVSKGNITKNGIAQIDISGIDLLSNEINKIKDLSLEYDANRTKIEADSIDLDAINNLVQNNDFRYKITNPEINNDGDVTITISVEKDNVTQQIDLVVKIVGISAAKEIKRKMIAGEYKNKTLSDDFRLPDDLTEIPARAFQGSTLPNGFSLPNDLEEIKNNAFFNATFMGNVIFPSQVQNIGADSFGRVTVKGRFDMRLIDGSKLNDLGNSMKQAIFEGDVILPSDLSVIGSGAFYGSIFKGNFVLPISVETIQHYAFHTATLPDSFINLPASLKTISMQAFKEANLLTRLTIPSSTSSAPNAFENTTYRQDEIDKIALSNEINKIKDLSLEYDANRTKIEADSIDLDAINNLVQNNDFRYKITNPEINNDGDVTITISVEKDNVTQQIDVVVKIVGISAAKEIKRKMIAGEYKNKTLSDDFRLPDDLTEIPARAFQGSTLPNGFSLPNDLEEIKNNAFKDATFMGNVIFPSQVKNIGTDSFTGVTIKGRFDMRLIDGASLNNLASSMKKATFEGDVILPSNLSVIGQWAFHKSTFEGGLVLPISATNIETHAFYQATLPDSFTTLPSGLETIGDKAFSLASLLVRLTIPSSTSSAPNAFENTIYRQDLDVNFPNQN